MVSLGNSTSITFSANDATAKRKPMVRINRDTAEPSRPRGASSFGLKEVEQANAMVAERGIYLRAPKLTPVRFPADWPQMRKQRALRPSDRAQPITRSLSR